MRKPVNNFGGELGAMFDFILMQLRRHEPRRAPGIVTRSTSRGVIRRPILKPVPRPAPSQRVAYVVSETRQWLKCQLPDQVDTEFFTWVAKPPWLRSQPAVTAETYPDVNWAESFVGHQYIYRNPQERLRRWCPYASDVPIIPLDALTTPYEAWPDGANYSDRVGYAPDVEDIDYAGVVSWVYDFEVLHPAYVGVGTQGWNPDGNVWTQETGQRAIYIAPVDEAEMVAGKLDDEPEDETFAGPFYIDITPGRQWVAKAIAQPSRMTFQYRSILSQAGSYELYPQYTDQLHGESNPQIKTELLGIWPELTPP